MASPFSIFRKRQKVMIAVLGVLTMFAFVFIPILMQGSGSRGPANPVAVKTSKFGNLRASDLTALRERRQRIRAVFSDLGQKVGVPAAVLERAIDEQIGPATDEAVVETWLKARYAQQLGIIVSNDAVNAFLARWAAMLRNGFNADDVTAVLARPPAISQNRFFDMMRDELAAKQLNELFIPSVFATTPGQRWDYFNRLKRMATIEAIPLAVADYIGKVDDPTEPDLKRFFEEHKEKLPDPTSPGPGFKVPHRVAFQYFKADVDAFAKKVAVTDQEILTQYQKQKDYYNQRYKVAPRKKPIVVKPAAAMPPIVPPKDAKDAGKANPPAGAKQTPAAPAQPAKTEPVKPKAAEPPKMQPDKPKDSKTGASADRSPFMLTSMLADEKTDDKKAPAAPPKAAAPANAQPPAKAETPAKPQPQTPAAKEPPKANEQAKPAEANPAAKPPTAAELVEDMPADMRNGIREQLARQAAYKKIVEIFVTLRKPMDEYQKTLSRYNLEVLRLKREKKEVPPPPPGPDFEKLAKEYGLTADRTGLISQWQAGDTVVATWLPGEMSDGDIRVSRMGRVIQTAYQSPATFRPSVAVASSTGACYLYWKCEDAEEYVPDFKDVRAEVARAWKLPFARDLAKKSAESLAAEATKADKPLAVVFKDRPDLCKRIIEPPKFSWMTLGSVAFSMSEQAELSTVSGIPMVDSDFMRTVFSLEPGQAGVALNVPKSIVYVVRASQFTPSYDVRWKLFEVDDFRKSASVANEDIRHTVQAWVNELKTSAGLEWTEEYKKNRNRAGQGRQSPLDVPDDGF
jgi:hypothetical protein